VSAGASLHPARQTENGLQPRSAKGERSARALGAPPVGASIKLSHSQQPAAPGAGLIRPLEFENRPLAFANIRIAWPVFSGKEAVVLLAAVG
jgi:hypothetical protein